MLRRVCQSTCEFLVWLQEIALHWLRGPLSAWAFWVCQIARQLSGSETLCFACVCVRACVHVRVCVHVCVCVCVLKYTEYITIYPFQFRFKSIFAFWGCWSHHLEFPGYARDITRISLRVALRTLDLQIHALNSLPSGPRA